jgi:hypothetical protein
MAVSLIRLDQLRKTDDPDDTLSAANISTIETNAVDHLDFLQGILSQIKRIIHGSDSGNWHDNVETIGDSLKDLAARATLEGKNIITFRQNITDVSVPSSQNYVALSGSGKPDKNIAINATTQGGVVAQLAGSIGSHSLDENSGASPLRPKNLVAVFDGSSGDPIFSSGYRVWALLQVGSAATDGNAFGDSGNDQGQLSFVRANSTYADLEACPVADIESTDIVYAFSWREDLNDMPEEFFRGDLESADDVVSPQVSLDAAYDGGVFMEVDASDVDIRLADTNSWVVRNGSGGTIIWQLTRNDTTGDQLTLTLDDVDINNVNSVDIAQGLQVDTSDQTLNLGHNSAGTIDSTSLTTEATAGDNLVKASADVKFQTVRETTALPLDDATAGAISQLSGGPYASVAAAIGAALTTGGVDMTLKVTTLGSNYNQDANIPGAIQNITSWPIDMETPGSVEQFVFLNGRLLHGGNGTTQNDVYAGDTPGNGDIKVDFPKGVKTDDIIISIVLAA